MIRGHGYAKSLDDFRNIVVPNQVDGTPIRLQDLGEVSIGPDLLRGVAELDGTGAVVSGIVIMRSGENALEFIDTVKDKLKVVDSALPEGGEVVPIYQR